MLKKHLKRKIIARRERFNNIEYNPSYHRFELDPECSKAFGFPDNGAMLDPDMSLINSDSTSNIQGLKLLSNHLTFLGDRQNKFITEKAETLKDVG